MSDTTQQQPSNHPGNELKDLPVDEVFKRLHSSPAGLSPDEARQRLAQYGYNELKEERTSPILTFLAFFWGPIPWMIEAAAILSAIVRHWPDFGIIMVLLLANAIVGFWEEYHANNTIAALKARLALQATVMRGKAWQTVPAREVVPGDVIRLRLGQVIPADARLLSGDPIEVDQSALTGESLPVIHKSGDAVFSGSVVKQGEIEALVYGTGVNTYFGKTAELVAEAHTRSHLQRAVLKIGDYLIIVALALAAAIIAVSAFRHDPVLTTLRFVLVLTVAAVPAAMPTVLSITMAVGARYLARKQAIVTRLAAIEEMAGIDVLCSDKTGTLTQNKLTLGEPAVIAKVQPADLILAGALASRKEDNDPIDLAVLGGLPDESVLQGYQVTHFLPFDPVQKRTEATVKGSDGQEFKVSKGAPQVILDLAADKDQVRDRVEQAVNDFAQHGYRSLGVARTDGNGQWHFLGVLPLFDPPREDSRETIQTAREMGIKTKMITGDQVAIAHEIAGKLGLGANILDAQVFEQHDQADEDKVGAEIEAADGFAQVFPEHKFRIVSELQKRGHIVGMTGDGVNDAPPLKQADAGIAVSGATDAARAAADVVLLEPGLSVIIDGIKENRRSFQRMNSYATYRIAETIRVLLFMTLSILVFNFYPVTAIMIVLLALLNDGSIISIAYDRVRYSPRPERWNMRNVLTLSSILGVVGVFASFGLFYLAERVFHLDREMVQSFMYLKLSVAGSLTIYVTRTRGPFWSLKPSRVLFLAVLTAQTVATLVAVYGLFMPAVGWGWAAVIWGYALVWFVIADLAKLATHRFVLHDNVSAVVEENQAS